MKKILTLFFGIISINQLLAQNSTIDGTHMGGNDDIFIVNWDNTTSADAGIRLATKKNSYHRHWNIFNERENANLHFSYSNSTSSWGGNVGTRKMVLTNSGNLGIGDFGTTSIPLYPLHIKKSYSSNWQARFQNGNSNVYLAHSSGYGMHINTGGSNSSSRYGLEVRNATNTHLYVRDDGKVGIGNKTPSYPLDVSGDIRANNGWIRSQGDYGLYNNSDGTYIYSDDANYWRIRSDRGITIANKANARKGVIYHDNANSFGLLDADQQWSVRFERDSNTRWYINNSQKMTLDNSGLALSGRLRRTSHSTGHLEGSYNNVGENSTKSNPIYTIGSSYNPGDATLGNMYGVGYTHKNASFINSTDLGITPAGSWGMYVASDGNARIFLDAAQGNGYFKGNLHSHGHVYGRSANDSYSNLYRFGGLYLTWDSDSYGTNTHHSIRSTYGDTYGDNMTINTFNNLRINLDANNNDEASTFEIGHNTTHTENIIFKVQEDGKVGIGTTTPDHKLSVVEGKLNLANTTDETKEYLRLYHDGQANISTDTGAVHFRKDAEEYLVAEQLSDTVSRIHSSGKQLVFRSRAIPDVPDAADPLGDLTIKGDGTVVIERGLEINGGGNLQFNNISTDNNYDYVLALDSGRLAKRSVTSLTPWVIRQIYHDSDTIELVTCDPHVDGLPCTCEPGTHISIDSTSIVDIQGNLVLGELGFIDNDKEAGPNNSAPGQLADDYLRIQEFIEVSSSDSTRGLILNDVIESSNSFFNLSHNDGVSFFSNSTVSTPRADYFMKAGTGVPAEKNHVTFPEKVTFNNGFTTSSYTSPDQMTFALDTDNSNNDALFQLGRGTQDADDETNWFGLFSIDQNGLATFSSDVGDTSNPNRVTIDGSIGKISMNGDQEVGGSSTIAGDLAVGGTVESPNVQVDGSTGNANFSGKVKSDSVEAATLVGNRVTTLVPGGSEVKAITVFNTTDNAEVFRVYNNGIVEAKEVLVSLDVWHDEVFEEDYELMPVEELETYVNKNHHLPEVPAEKEVIEKGVNVGEMQATLLKKIEQLTLYVIDQNKQLKAQAEKIKQLEHKLD